RAKSATAGMISAVPGSPIGTQPPLIPTARRTTPPAARTSETAATTVAQVRAPVVFPSPAARCMRGCYADSRERRVAHLGQLLKRPRIAVGVAEKDEGAPIHDLDVAGLDPPPAQLVLQSLGVLD